VSGPAAEKKRKRRTDGPTVFQREEKKEKGGGGGVFAVQSRKILPQLCWDKSSVWGAKGHTGDVSDPERMKGEKRGLFPSQAVKRHVFQDSRYRNEGGGLWFTENKEGGRKDMYIPGARCSKVSTFIFFYSGLDCICKGKKGACRRLANRRRRKRGKQFFDPSPVKGKFITPWVGGGNEEKREKVHGTLAH